MSAPIEKSSSLRLSFQLKKANIAIVMSRFNEKISRALLEGARRGLQKASIPKLNLEIIEVPGAFEIPLAAKWALQKNKFDGVICLGAVIRGETPHFDYVCQGVTQGLMQAQLETGKPMAFGVLTVNTVEQALERSGDNEENKGFECAQVVLEMIEIQSSLKS